jgi:hypothetical protein
LDPIGERVPGFAAGPGAAFVTAALVAEDRTVWLATREVVWRGDLERGFAPLEADRGALAQRRIRWLSHPPGRPEVLWAQTERGDLQRLDGSGWTTIHTNTGPVRACHQNAGGFHPQVFCGGMAFDGETLVALDPTRTATAIEVDGDRATLVEIPRVPAGGAVTSLAQTPFGPTVTFTDGILGAVVARGPGGWRPLYGGEIPSITLFVVAGYREGLVLSGARGFVTVGFGELCASLPAAAGTVAIGGAVGRGDLLYFAEGVVPDPALSRLWLLRPEG